MANADKPQAEARDAYTAFRSISTRWMDNDVYGHVNNVVYYSWFDTAVNGLLIDQGVLDIHAGATIGLVVETQCHYFAPLAFPQTIEAGVRVAHMGTSSVRYEVGLFAQSAHRRQRAFCARLCRSPHAPPHGAAGADEGFPSGLAPVRVRA
jgi:acyl-CoA thioester hydrolase